MKRKLLATLMCVMMVLSALPTTGALADTYTITDNIKTDGTLSVDAPEGATITWQRKVDGGNWESVAATKTCNGATFDVVKNNGKTLSVTADILGLEINMENPVSYKAVVNGTETAAYTVPYYNSLQNASFETPVYSSRLYSSYGGVYSSTRYLQLPNGYTGLVWKTTGSDGAIELSGTYTDSSGGPGGSSTYSPKGAYNVNGSHDGVQFAELNCEEIGSIYQDVLTTPGAYITWQVAHNARGAGKTNTMYVVMMSTYRAEGGYNGDIEGIDGVIDTQDEVEAIMAAKVAEPYKYRDVQVWAVSTENDPDKWHVANNEDEPYYVPKGQCLTRFFFVSTNETTSQTEGNLLDAVSFTEEVPSAGSIKVTKTVSGLTTDELTALAPNGYRVSVSLTSTNNETITGEITVDPETLKGEYTFTNLEDGGVYTLSETPVALEGYELSTTYSPANQNVTAAETTTNASITNTYTLKKVSVSATKVWDADEGVEIPENITLQLYANGEACGEGVVVSADEDGKYSYTWENLEPKDENGLDIIYYVYETAIGGNTLTNGEYAVMGKEEVNGVEVDVVVGKWASQSALGDDGNYTITNTYTAGSEIENTDDGSCTLWVKKVNDSGVSLIDGAEFTLTKGNEVLSATKVSPGMFKFEGLTDGTYTLTETVVPEGYAPDDATEWSVKVEKGSVKEVKPVEGQENAFVTIWNYIASLVKGEGESSAEISDNIVTIKNRKLTHITVNKEWVTTEGGEGSHEVKLQLYANGEASGDEVSLNEQNNYSYTWENLYEYDKNGQKIAYTVKEVSVDGAEFNDEGIALVNEDGTTVGQWQTSTASVTENTYKITNTYKTLVTSITVNKVWKDVPEWVSLPESVTLQLMRNGEIADWYSVKVNKTMNWSATFDKLEKYDKNGNEYTYTAVETEIGNEIFTKGSNEIEWTDNGVKLGKWVMSQEGNTITNTFVTDKTKLTIEKKWVNTSQTPGVITPASATVAIYAGDSETALESGIVLNSDNSWKAERTLAKFDESGNQIQYRVYETAIGGEELVNGAIDVMDGNRLIGRWVSSVEGSVVTNTFVTNLEEITISKTWRYNQEDITSLPESVTLQLYANGQAYGDEIVLSSSDADTADSNIWKKTVSVEKKDAQGNDITYTVAETKIGENALENGVYALYETRYKYEENSYPDGYSVLVGKWSATSDGLNVVNTYTKGDEPVFTPAGAGSFTVKKVDDLGEALTGAEFTLTGENDFSSKGIAQENGTQFLFENLAEGTYTLTETVVPKGYCDWRTTTYTVKVSKNGIESITADTSSQSENAFVVLWKYIVSSVVGEEDLIKNGVLTVTNYKEETVTIEKKWVNVPEGMELPENVTVEYDAGGVVGEITLNAENNWSGSFTYLKYDDEGKEITPTVEETRIGGVELSKDGEADCTINGKVVGKWVMSQEGYTITNTFVPSTVDVTFTKEWDDMEDLDGLRPDSITIDLYADEKVVEGKSAKITEDEDGNWSYTFEGLTQYDAYGNEIVYTAIENSVDGYDTSYSEDGYVITNTHIPVRDITVSKTVAGTGASKTQEFTFTITLLTEKDGEELAGEFCFENQDGEFFWGKNGGSFTLSDGETMTIKNVPVGSYYVVEETEAHGYTPKATNEEGSVEENGAKVEFVNTFNAPKTGDESKIGLGFAAFSVSAVVALAVVAAKKRREAK